MGGKVIPANLLVNLFNVCVAPIHRWERSYIPFRYFLVKKGKKILTSDHILSHKVPQLSNISKDSWGTSASVASLTGQPASGTPNSPRGDAGQSPDAAGFSAC